MARSHLDSFDAFATLPSEKRLGVKPKGFLDRHEDALQHVALFGAVGSFAIVGWVTRACLKQAFATELGVIGAGAGGGVLHGDVVANMVGAFVFGFMSKTQRELQSYHPTIYFGLTAGFAGSCTTFSSWMLEIGVAVWVPGDDWARQMLRGLFLMIGGFHCLYSSLSMGQWVGSFVINQYHSRIARDLESGDGSPKAEEAKKRASRLSDPGAAVKAGAPMAKWVPQKALFFWCFLVTCWLVVLIQVAITVPEGDVDVIPEDPNQGKFGATVQTGMCFAPFGAWLRFQSSKYNARYPTFPVFTFAANLTGTLLSVLLWIAAREIQVEDVVGKTMFARSDVWISGISGGFCGCLSTASTFANELFKLAVGPLPAKKPSVNALVYAGASLFSAQLLLCIVILFYNSYINRV